MTDASGKSLPRGTQGGRSSVLGAPLSLSSDDIDTAAVITSVDVSFARVVWQQHAPPPLADLLDAAAAEE